jgi:two-component system, response regulator, stage 0 sporulation protein F
MCLIVSLQLWLNLTMAKLDILIIEDDVITRTMLKALLEDYTKEIRQLANGRYATKAIDLQLPDLVLTDLVMPRKDGLQVVEEIKQNHPSLPVYVMSANPDYIAHAKGLGADEVFIKPIDMARLIECIEKLQATPRSSTP